MRTDITYPRDRQRPLYREVHADAINALALRIEIDRRTDPKRDRKRARSERFKHTAEI